MVPIHENENGSKLQMDTIYISFLGAKTQTVIEEPFHELHGWLTCNSPFMLWCCMIVCFNFAGNNNCQLSQTNVYRLFPQFLSSAYNILVSTKKDNHSFRCSKYLISWEHFQTYTQSLSRIFLPHSFSAWNGIFWPILTFSCSLIEENERRPP